MRHSDFDIRMKKYEKHFTDQKLIPNLPVIARIDGKAFHTFCKNLDKPFDEGLMSAMIDTTKELVEFSNALIGYTQSDEITLIWNNNYNSPMMFDGKIYKLNSVLASKATAIFNRMFHTTKYIPSEALFDCRVWNVPSKAEASNVLLWREQDATRNSIQMLGQSVFSHNQLQNKSCSDIQDMLHEKNINWNNLQSSCKRGTYVKRILETRSLTNTEIENLPPKHEARLNPDLKVHRHKTVVIDMPIFSTVINKECVIFDKSNPLLEDCYCFTTSL